MNTVALDSITAETDIFHHVSVLVDTLNAQYPLRRVELELFPSAFCQQLAEERSRKVMARTTFDALFRVAAQCTGGNTTSSSYHLDGFYLRHFLVVPLDAVFLVLYHLRVFADLHQADLKTLVLRNCAFVTAKVVERFQRLLDHNNIPSARVPSHVESHPAPVFRMSTFGMNFASYLRSSSTRLHSDTRTSLPSSSTSARDPSSSIPPHGSRSMDAASVSMPSEECLAGRTSLIVRRMDTPEPSTPSASRSRIPTILISPLSSPLASAAHLAHSPSLTKRLFQDEVVLVPSNKKSRVLTDSNQKLPSRQSNESPKAGSSRRRQHATRSIRKPQKEFAFVQEKGDQEAIEDILDDGPQTSPITKAMPGSFLSRGEQLEGKRIFREKENGALKRGL
ncbi:hypothetical protein CPB85DRAFT_1309591 [Mucidula mucida]|nr:hypothetical protein CPB85DRAFT_1309591 [Mucidula mucida]